MQDPFAVFDDGSQSSAHVRDGGSHGGMRAEALLREYQRALDATDRQLDLVIRTASIGFTVAGGLLYLIASTKVKLPEWATWLAPQFLVLVYSLILLFVWEIVYRSYYARDLENELASTLDIDFLHYENNLARGLTSFSTGHPAHIVLYLMMILFGASLYVALVVLGLFLLRGEGVPTWRQAVFVVVYFGFGLVLLWSWISIAQGLRARYLRWRTVESSFRDHRLAPPYIGRLVAYAVLPRPFDFLFKAVVTIGSTIATMLALRIALSWNVFLHVAMVILCVDFLAKQATYVWNDILDAHRDRKHPQKAAARPLSRVGATGVGKGLFFARSLASFLVAIFLGAELGMWWTLPLVATVFVWQALYDRWAKTSPTQVGDRSRVFRRLSVAAIGYTERSVAGVLAVMAAENSYNSALVVLLALWSVAFAFLFLAEYWWAEEAFLWMKRTNPAPSTALKYLDKVLRENLFIQYGPTVERVSNALLFPIGLYVAFVFARNTDHRKEAVTGQAEEGFGNVVDVLEDWWTSIEDWFRSWNPIEQNRSFSLENDSLWLVAASAFGILFMIAARKTIDSRPAWRWPALAFVVSTGVVLVLATPVGLRAIVIVLLVPLAIAINYEQLTYEEITAFDLRKILPALRLATNRFLFREEVVVIAISSVGEDLLDYGNWPDELASMYKAWGARQGLAIRDLGGGQGERCRLLAGGPTHVVGELIAEQGYHHRVFVSAGPGWRPRITTPASARTGLAFTISHQPVETQVALVKVTTASAFLAKGTARRGSIRLTEDKEAAPSHHVRDYFGWREVQACYDGANPWQVEHVASPDQVVVGALGVFSENVWRRRLLRAQLFYPRSPDHSSSIQA